MGGLLVPVLPDYFMVDLARQMDLRILVVTDNVLGAVHNTVSTLLACRHRGAEVAGIILNFMRDGYGEDLLRQHVARRGRCARPGRRAPLRRTLHA